MELLGRVNPRLVSLIQQSGGRAVGLSGIDGRLWEGDRKAAIRSVENGKVRIIRDDFTGKVTRINTHLLSTLIDAGYQPVLTSPAISTEGEAINVDADRAAAMTAASLNAHTLMMLSNVPGLLAEFPDESSLIPEIKRSDIERAAEAAQDRMKKKVLGAAEALDEGVGRVIFGDARIDEPITNALAGRGTVFS